MGKVVLPVWKKWLSYIREIHIESAPSRLNPHLYVSLQKGRYQLSTAHAIYSFEDLYDNFGAAFKLIDWNLFNPNRILLLGGGLLSVPYLLEKYIRNFEITVVEYDEEVIYLATKYMLDKLTMPIQMVHADASDYIQICQEKYDLIVIDIFEDDIIPEPFLHENFLDQVIAVSEPHTLILYNRLSRTVKDLNSTKIYYESVFNPKFERATYFDVQGNWVLSNTNQYNL